MPGKRNPQGLSYEGVMARLHALASPALREGMARFGINPERALGISVTMLRALAKETGKSHDLALQLWDSGVHEARILATIVDDPRQVTRGQMEAWVREFDSWDLCDGACGNLFDKTPWAFEKAEEWARREREFEKRAGFALMAWLAVHDKRSLDEKFERFFPLIEASATDDRNFVRKAVNWALRQMGKRNSALNARAIQVSETIQRMDSRAARWIAADALRELTSAKVQARREREEA